MAKEDTIEKLNDYFQSSLDNTVWRSFRDNAIRDFEFTEGTQLSAEEIKKLEKRGQPPIVENEIHPVIEHNMGIYKRQKTRIRYRGRNLGGDESSANILSDLSLHSEQESDYEFEESDMVRDGFISGGGAMEVYMEIDDMLQPKVMHRHEDILNIFPDPNSKRYDWNIDSDFLCRAKWMSLGKAKSKWKSKASKLQALANLDPVDDNDTKFVYKNYVDQKAQMVRPVEIWYKDYSQRKIAVIGDSTVDISNYSKTQVNKLKKEHSDMEIIESVNHKLKHAIFLFNIMLTEPEDVPHDHNYFPIVPFWVFRKKNGEPYSVVRHLIDPQTEINKRRSKALHHLNTNQVTMDENAVRDIDTLKTEVAKPDGVIEKKAGKELVIDKNVEVAQTQMLLLTESKDAIRRISGVTNNSSELPREVRSGVGLARAQAISDVRMLPQFNNLRRTRLMIGNIRLELIKQYYTPEKTYLVTDDLGKAKEFKLTKGVMETIKSSNYDTIVEEAPDVTTIQDEQAQRIDGFLQAYAKVMPVSIALEMFILRLQLSDIRGKNELIEGFIEKTKNAKPELPKTQLQLQWAELTPEEKVAFANMLGMQPLAQAVATNPDLPNSTKKEAGETQRKQMDSQTKIVVEAMKNGKNNKTKSQ